MDFLKIIFAFIGLNVNADVNVEHLNSFIVYGKIGGTAVLKCIDTRSITNCIWLSQDATGNMDTIINNGQVISGDPRYKIPENWKNGDCSLTISSIKETDARNYSCTTYLKEDVKHVAKNRLIIGVQPTLPVILYKGENVTSQSQIEIKEELPTLQCIVSNGKPDALINWPGFPTDAYKLTKEETKLTSTLTLNYQDLEAEKEKIVFCNASHPFYLQEFVVVNVSIGVAYPTNAVNITPAEIKTGEKLTCNANGIPKPHIYIWKSEPDKKQVHNLQTYIPKEKGTFSCFAQNALSSLVQSKNKATVKDIIQNVSHVEVKIEWDVPTLGDTALCEANGNLPIAYRWYHKNQFDFKWREVGREKEIILGAAGFYYCRANTTDRWVRSSNRIFVSSVVL